MLEYLIVCPLIFFGGFVDAVAGGGGNYIGAKYFTKKGAGFVKPLIIAVLSIFFVKLCWEMFLRS